VEEAASTHGHALKPLLPQENSRASTSHGTKERTMLADNTFTSARAKPSENVRGVQQLSAVDLAQKNLNSLLRESTANGMRKHQLVFVYIYDFNLRYLGDASWVQRLLKAGAEPFDIDEVSHTSALTIAQSRNFSEILQLFNGLIQNTGSSNQPTASTSRETVAFAVQAHHTPSESLSPVRASGSNVAAKSKTQTPTVKESQITAGIEIAVPMRQPANSETKSLLSAFHKAAQRGNAAAIRNLLTDKVFQVDVPDDTGKTALHWACANGRKGVCEILLSHNASISAKDTQGWTPFHFAVAQHRLSIIILLSQQTAILNGSRVDEIFQANNGDTPLHCAVQVGAELDVIEALTKFGFSPSFQNHVGQTSMEVSVSQGLLEISEHFSQKFGVSIPVETDIQLSQFSKSHARSAPAAESTVRLTHASESLLKESGSLTHEGMWRLFLKSQDSELTTVLENHRDGIFASSSTGKTLLHEAAEAGLPFHCKFLIAAGCSVQKVDQNGKSVLHSAIESLSAETVKVILDSAPALIGVCDRKSISPLILTLQLADSPSIVQLLLSAGLSLGTVEASGMNPLKIAQSLGRIKSVRLLAQKEEVHHNQPVVHPISTMKQDGSKTALSGNTSKGGGLRLSEDNVAVTSVLHDAAKSGSKPVLEFVLSSGVNVDCVDSTGATALMLACLHGSMNCLHLLILHGASTHLTDNRGFNVIHYACDGSSEEVLRYLLLIDQDRSMPLKCDNQGRNGLWHAVESKSPGLCQILLESSPSILNNKLVNGQTILHRAVASGLEVMRLLLDHGAKAEWLDSNSCSVIDLIVMEGHPEYIQILGLSAIESHTIVSNIVPSAAASQVAGVQKPSDYEMIQLQNQFWHACSQGLLIDVKILVSQGVDMNCRDDDGRSGLILAALNGHGEIAAQLLQQGADPFIRLFDGKTALHIAVAGNFEKCTRLMLQYCPKVNDWIECHDREGYMAIHYAALAGNIDILRIFLEDIKQSASTKTIERLTPLMCCIIADQPHITSWMAKHFPKCMNEVSCHGDSALHLAVCSPGMAHTSSLLAAGASFGIRNFKGLLPIHLAKTKEVRDLLGSTIISAKNSSGGPFSKSMASRFIDKSSIQLVEDFFTKCHSGNDQGCLECIKQLFSDRFDAMQPVDDSGNTLLHFCAGKGLFECVQYILSTNSRCLDLSNLEGMTPSHFAIKPPVKNNVLLCLCSNNARFDLRDWKGYSVLHYAAMDVLELEVLQQSLSTMAASNREAALMCPDNHGNVPILLAVASGSIEHIAEYVNASSHQTDIFKIITDTGDNILHISATSSIEIAELICTFQGSCDFRLKNALGLSPVDICMKNRRDDIAEVFSKYTARNVWVPPEHSKSQDHPMSASGSSYVYDDDEDADDLSSRPPSGALRKSSRKMKSGSPSGIPQESMSVLSEKFQPKGSEVQEHPWVYLGSRKSWVEVFNQVTSASMTDLNTVCDKDGNHLLHLAAIQGELNALETLIECHVDVNILNGFGETALHVAAATRVGGKGLVEVLLKAGASPNISNDFGKTVIHVASESGNTDIIFVLLSGGQTNFMAGVAPLGFTALHFAVMSGNVEAVKLFCHYHELIDIQTNIGDTALHFATFHSQIVVACDMSKVLLLAGADISIRNNEGVTPFQMIDSRSDVEHQHQLRAIFKLFLDDTGKQSLQNKGLSNETTIKRKVRPTSAVGIMPSIEAEVEEISDNAIGDLFLTSQSSNATSPVASLLEQKFLQALENNSTNDIQVRCNRDCPSKRIAAALTIVQGYLDAGFQCKNLMMHGSPALFYVIQNCSTEMLMVLLEAGASMETLNDQGQTAVLAAIQLRKENAINVLFLRLHAQNAILPTLIFQILLGRGCNLDSYDYDGMTALHLAAEQGLLLVVRHLIEEFSMDPTVMSQSTGGPQGIQLSAMHVAILSNRTDVVDYFCSIPELVETETSLGDAPLHLACMTSLDCVRLLLQAGANPHAENSEGKNPHQVAAFPLLAHSNFVSPFCLADCLR
jgi:ankyrin repeat protein